MATLASLSIYNNIICRGGSTEGSLGFGICALQSTNGGNIKNHAFANALQRNTEVMTELKIQIATLNNIFT